MMNILTKDGWIMAGWGIQHRYTPNDNEYVFVGQQQCVHTDHLLVQTPSLTP